MLDARIKFLASLYTVLLMSALVSLLLFGGFKMKTPPAKGRVIQATMVDISQLKPRKKSNNKTVKPKKKEETKAPIKPPENKPEIKEVKKVKPKEKEVKKTDVKKDPPLIVKKEPKIDTKAQELERKKRQQRQKKLKEIRKKRKAAEKRRKIEEQRLKELTNKTKKQPVIEDTQVTAVKKGPTDADIRNQLMAQYQAAVITSVERQWNKPATATKDLICHVKVRQIPGGGVIDATIATPCNANSIVKKSILAAISKADPLPYKGFEKVFSRTATFIFQPQE
jgi:colicin import membrane protein